MKIPKNMYSRPRAEDAQPSMALADGVAPAADYLGCAACCAGKAGFGACLARCLATNQCCDGGLNNCTSL